ncbi:YciI family protein [Amycolatopsis sp. lyj-109]|uniref:YciI family protein n=1 Tax=Amycolatopsis sp. lyj-109 TaxID=2789287 RepID=UPI0039781CDA
MEFFCYHRDRPGSLALRQETLEANWSYMDRYATRMIAHGPLLSDDGTAWLGTAALTRAASPSEARTILTGDRYAAVEVHTWRFGGRVSASPAT